MTRIGLSTSSVYPESTAHAFGYAASLGYDAVEVMVIDALSQSISAVKQLSEHHGIPVSAIHAPCLLFTQRVWGTEPWGKLERSAEMAAAVGAEVVVVHPPFRWQKEYAARLRQRHRRARGVDRHRVRGREHVPVAGLVEARHGDVPARLGPLGRALRQHHHRPLARRDRPRRPDRDGRPARAPGCGTSTSPTAPARPRTSTWCPGRGTVGAAEFLRHVAAHRLPRRDRARDQHPQGGSPRGARERPARVAGVRPRALLRARPA